MQTILPGLGTQGPSRSASGAWRGPVASRSISAGAAVIRALKSPAASSTTPSGVSRPVPRRPSRWKVSRRTCQVCAMPAGGALDATGAPGACSRRGTGDRGMIGLDDAALALAAAVVKSALKVWIGDRPLAADASASAVDLLSGRATDFFQRRRVDRMLDQMYDTVAARIVPILRAEFSDVPEHERLAALDAVRDTFASAALTDDDLFAHDLDAAYVDRFLRTQVPDMPARSLLSAGATALYDVLLRECCEYLVQVTMTLPRFSPGALTEILRRETEILDALREILARLPERREGRGRADFELDYRRQVANQLDRMELFGATVSAASRRYPLVVAYISLSVSAEDAGGPVPGPREELGPSGGEAPAAAAGSPVEHALAGTRRLFLRGGAGGGTTTLLRWVAVHSALGDF